MDNDTENMWIDLPDHASMRTGERWGEVRHYLRNSGYKQPVDFSHRDALAFAAQLPEVRALVEKSKDTLFELETVYRLTTGAFETETGAALKVALAPFEEAADA